MFSGTVFDYNGVLVDDEVLHFAAFRELLEPLGVALTQAEYYHRYIGYDDAGAFGAVLSDAGRAPTNQQIAALVQAKRPAYRRLAAGALLGFAGAAELVRRRAGLGPVLVVSGALRDEIQLGLEQLGVLDCIAHIVSAEDTTAGKPDPQGYLLALDYLTSVCESSRPARALVIEDTPAGIQAAKSAGMVCIAVAHSFSVDELKKSSADWVVDQLAAISDQEIAELYARVYP
ncbi:MAG TPA: HAD family phosphatase [Polyangiaceae bacterium]|jgi:beta-phosphoglucomutase-like phosphatase (HAD superfamily)